MTPLDFLQLLWSNKPDELYILIWTLQGKQSYWFQSIEPAAEFVRGHLTDAYVGVGLSKQDCGSDHRCLSTEVAAIPAVWADFDIQSPAHSKNLPSSIDEALSVIPASLPPTIIIATGNGVHAWWLFKEPWIFVNDDERKEAATLIYRFQTLLQYNASQRGWAFDRLADLARVLRIPGTVNGKDPQEPKQVTVHSFRNRRYNPSEFADFLDDLSIPDPEAEQSAAKDWKERFNDKPIAINLSVRIPQEMLDRWCKADSRFKNTWFRQRSDLKDPSQSGYDMALACFGVAQKLEEQQIVDLIIHHRFQHRQKPRTGIDYFHRTIFKAANSCSHSPSISRAEPASDRGTADSADPEIAKAQTWDRLSAMLGIRIYRLVKITGKNPIYRMDLEEDRVEFSSVKKLISQESFRCNIAAATNKCVPKQKGKAWDEIAQVMLNALTEEEGGEEMQLEGAARLSTSQYLADTGFIDAVEGQNTQNARKPMIFDGAITLCSNDFQFYLNKTTGQNLPVSAIASMLSVIGGKSFRLHRKGVDQWRWKLPPGEFDPAKYSAQYREDFNHGE
jgi:hypothetical protein